MVGREISGEGGFLAVIYSIGEREPGVSKEFPMWSGRINRRIVNCRIINQEISGVLNPATR
jgi:hypothetical protein